MTSSISWIDRDGLEATLARIGVGGRRPPTAPARGTGVNFVPSPPKLVGVVDPVVPEDGITTEFIAPEGALRHRLNAFMAWLTETTGAQVAFIVDRDGLPLVDRDADPDLLAIASSVMRLLESINSKLFFPVGRAVSLELEEGQLVLISVATPIGKYIVGQVGNRPLRGELRLAISTALRRAFQPSLDSAAVGS